MKMAKASEADIEAAEELAQVLNALDERNRWGSGEVGDTPEFFEICDSFDPYDFDHLQALHDKLMRLMHKHPSFHNRVISGFCHVIMYDKNEIVDPDSDCLELHPRFQENWDEMERQASYARDWNRRYHQMKEQRDSLLSALKAKVDNDYPFTCTVSRDELIAYWENEHKLGRGCAKDELAAIEAITSCEVLP